MKLRHDILCSGANKWIFAFYGFGQDASLFLPLKELVHESHNILVIHLPYEKMEQPLEKSKWVAILQSLITQYGIRKITGISFSMGSRLNLLMAELLPEYIEALYLIAPDGIRFRWWTNLATNTFLGRKMFRFLCQHHSAYEQLITFMYHWHILPKSLYTFSKWHMRDFSTRQKVYHSWMNLSKMKPNLLNLQKQVEKYSLKVVAYFGDEDPIIDATCLKILKRKLPSAEVIVLNKGHKLADKDLFSDIASRLIC